MQSIRCSLVVFLAAALFACGDNKEAGTDATSGPQCSDHVDNDGDGMTDFPDDLGCEDANSDTESSPVKPQCMDNRDNDGDGKVDFPNDPGCPAPQADDEIDNCPSGPGCPQCSDGIDNDGNGKTDFPDDASGCSSAYDAIEFTDDPTACGQGMVIKQLPPTNTDTGTLVGTTSNVGSPCGGGNMLPAVAYVFHISTPMVIVASTDDAMTMIDTVLDLRTSMCSVASSEVACHDDITPGTGTGNNHKSKITKSLKAGTYYLIVGGKTTADTGQYVLNVQFLPGEGTSCTTSTDCGPTLECRVPVGETQKICTGPVCDDGRDDDGDGKIDYPVDPGCASQTDSTENDTCATPSDPACPACANGIDDDMDGQIDYPNDPTCTAASTLGEYCAQSEPAIIATTPQTMGTTAASSGAINDYAPPKGSFNGHACASPTATNTAPDRAVQIDVPAMTSLSLRLSPVGFDSTQILFDASCGGTPIECYDSPTLMTVSNLAAGRYYLIIDGYSTASGTFTLNVSGTIVNGESCESPLAQSGAITCAVGYECRGTVGSRTCQTTQCNDGVDNNGDGKMDYPADPGCASLSDAVEDTVCPGASCPVCSDGLDNDGDTLTDYPADTGCLSASSTNEGCTSSEAVVAITAPTTTGTLVGAVDDHNPGCVASNQADKVFTLDIPTPLQRLVIDTNGSLVDTVLSLMGSTCSEPSIACDDDSGDGNNSLIDRPGIAAGSYSIAVDSDSATLDTFVLHVRGEVIPGGSCESALFQAGVLVCPPTYGCNGPVGSRTCSATQCHDGIDNNGDGTTDYPNDPSCDSASDNSETNVCPGASCPECADGVDNDMDGRTDYPSDTRCASAAGTAEGCGSEPTTSILMPVTSGTLVGATDDSQPSCVITTGADIQYSLTIPTLDSLTIDTEGSTVDTVLSFATDCDLPALACDNDGGVGTGDSSISRTSLQGGTYTITVDANGTAANTFNLNVRGVISPGQSCESPLFATGVLRCGLGFACDGPIGMRTCAVAQCIDGLDNNGDGLTDFPADPGCSSFSDDTEASVCPGPTCPACSDGVDNDGDGDTDYPADATCFSASSMNEACAQSEPVGVITQMTTTGNTSNQVNDYTPTCASTTHDAPDVIYQLDVPALATLSLNLTGFDTATTLLDSTCGGAPIQCSDPPLMTRTNVAAGTYYVVIDGWSTGSGAWTLTTTGTVAPGGSCEGPLFQDGAFTCTAGYACQGTVGSRTCELALCNDTIDNDGDGKNDFPADPGCTSISDNDEADDCSPVGPNCPSCSDGIDNDGDGMTDYPADTSCHNAAGIEFCTQSEGVGVITDEITFGSTTTASGAVNDNTPTCGTFTSHTAPDRTYQLDVPAMATLNLNLVGFNGVTTLLDATCSGTPIACSDPELMTRTNVAAGRYFVIVDGLTTGSGSFTLTTTGTVEPGASCEGVLFQSGAFTCTAGYACAGTLGSRTCMPSACTDGLDNDSDGKIDAADPGCTSGNDADESDDCSPTVGPNCPACSNGLDDDGDMQTDYPSDTRCLGPSFFAENLCPIEPDLAGQIITRSTSGTLVGAAANYTQSCQGTTNADVAYGLKLPVPVASLEIDTIGSTISDTVVSLWNASCSTEIGCDDDSDPASLRSMLTVSNVPAGEYAIQVDSFGTTTTNVGPYTLNVHGIVAPGTACTSELFGSGVLACPTGTSCTGGICQ